MPTLTPRPRKHARQGASPTIAEIARQVREARVAAGLSQTDLALTCGVARTTVIAVESGRPGVSIGKVERVLAGLGLSVTVVQAG